ncbi:MAG TPA: glycosyltransferase 87 family protein [Acidimicrobiales bacterium]|nr:glycosyltransferase 87 family protein [Acidimicrobiales bacterium]
MPDLRWAMRMAVVPWLVARVVVLAAWAVAHELAAQGQLSAAGVARVHAGLLGWDAGWYEAIARLGYGGAGYQSLRFFPLLPLVARAMAVVTGLGPGTAVVMLANVSALAAAAVVSGLARSETGDDALARRAAWFLCLAPPAFTFVMGYAEASFVALAAGAVWALRRRRWWWASGLGAAAALTRPIGVLLVAAAVVEAARQWRQSPGRERLARLGAVGGPVAGCGAFLAWVGWRYGDWLAPLRIQEEGGLRGRVTDPLQTLVHDGRLLVTGHHLGTALHLPSVLVAAALLGVALARWPGSYGAFAGAVLAVAVTASNLDGFERYSLSAFPLVMAAAGLVRSPRLERVVLSLAGAALALSAVLAFINITVP